MIVDGTHLPDFPANRNQLIECRFVDEITGIVLALPVQIWRECLRLDRRALQKSENLIRVNECSFRELPQLGNKVLDRERLRDDGSRHICSQLTSVYRRVIGVWRLASWSTNFCRSMTGRGQTSGSYQGMSSDVAIRFTEKARLQPLADQPSGAEARPVSGATSACLKACLDTNRYRLSRQLAFGG